ncbi:hypothetical protein Hanom_Chr07g00590041 [Helianthus anomalus]
MTRFQTFWIQIRKNKPLDESRKTSQTSETKMTFYSIIKFQDLTCTNSYLLHEEFALRISSRVHAHRKNRH